MLGSELYTLATFLLGGAEMDQDSFYTLINIKKAIRESMRDWMKLKKTDITKTLSSSDNYTSAKELPSDFSRWQKDRPVRIYESGNTTNYLDYFEVPLSEQLAIQNDSDKFYCDYDAMNAYFGGTRDRSYIIAMNYLKKSPTISANVGWIFGDLDAILAFDVVMSYKGGVDYDSVNARMAQFNGLDAKEIERALVSQDASLQVSSRRGANYNQSRVNGYRIKMN